MRRSTFRRPKRARAVAGLFDITGVGVVSLGSKTLTITNNVGPFDGVIQDGGIAGGTGGSVTIANGGLATFSGVNTYTGLTTINAGGELDLVCCGSIATSKAVINNGIFDISGLSGPATSIASLSGASTGIVNLGSNTLIITNANGTFAGIIQDGGAGGGLAITGGKEILTGANTYAGSTVITGAHAGGGRLDHRVERHDGECGRHAIGHRPGRSANDDDQ